MDKMNANDAMYYLQKQGGGARDTVIYVDDEEPIRRLYKRALGILLPGFHIKEAKDGQEALELILGDYKDRTLAVFSDLYMPMLHGDELMEIVSSPDENGEVLLPSDEVMKFLITGNGNQESIDTLMREGKINKVMEKPFDVDSLEVLIVDVAQDIRKKAEAVRKFL